MLGSTGLALSPNFAAKDMDARFLIEPMLMLAVWGFLFFRLYTDAKNNDSTLAFYRSLNMKEEKYLPNQDDFTDILIFSKSCHPFKKRVKAWNNKYLYIQEQLLLSQNDMLSYVKKKASLSLLIFLKHPSILWRFFRMSLKRFK